LLDNDTTIRKRQNRPPTPQHFGRTCCGILDRYGSKGGVLNSRAMSASAGCGHWSRERSVLAVRQIEHLVAKGSAKLTPQPNSFVAEAPECVLRPMTAR
jgi:hypothetical protein